LKVVAALLSVLYFGAVITLVVKWTSFTDYLERPGETSDAEAIEVVVVPEGTTATDVPGLLAKAGLLDDPEPFQRYVDDFHIARPIKPGEYAVTRSMTPVQKLGRIESGQLVTYTVAIRPGATANDVLGVLASQTLGDEAELARLVHDAEFAKSLGVNGTSLEGFLYPDAYDLPRGLTAKALLSQLVERHRVVAGAEVAVAVQRHGMSPYEIVTVASLVESAEVPNAERRLYARLILNRLKRRMPLQSRAAYEYGVSRVDPAKLEPEAVRRKRRRRKRIHPWDTSKNAGLPKTPICNPDVESIRAVAAAADSEAVFMVRRDDGTHVYCADFECYEAARYQVRGLAPPPPPPPPPPTEPAPTP
jgi:UPF0755 protein